ncbi:MAG: ABC transporter ATP-binding protein [Lachnospiraceae bacterium]
MKKNAKVTQAEEFRSVDEFTTVEDRFIDVYVKNKRKPIRVLLGLYRGHYSKFLLAGLCFFIKHSPVWMSPIVLANIINIAASAEEGAAEKIFWNTMFLVALIALNLPMNYFYTKCRSLAVRNVEAGLRGALVRKLQQLSISYHKEMQSGRLQSKIMRDVEAIETLSSQVFVSLMNIALNLGVSFAVTVSRSPMVFGFFLITVPIAVLTTVAFKKKIKESNSEFRKEMEETSARVMEMVELIPVTRAHALEQQEINKMERQLNEVAEKGYRLDIVQANFGAVSWCVFQAFQVLCLGFTGYLAYQGRISVGDIALYQTYFATIVNQVSNLITLLPTISKGTESLTSVGEVLLAHDVEDNRGKKKVSDIKGEFTFSHVSFSYDKAQPVLKDFDLKVKAGETIALVGESGAGKSTILNMVIGFNKPDGGRILLDGADMNTLNLRSYRNFLAVVPQNSILFSGTIRDNITYGLSSVTEEMLWKAIQAANLEEFIKSLPEGLNTRVGEHGGKLSGGQRQRISIARALIRDPKVIVLDEATSALDSVSEREIQKALENLKQGRTTFIVAHRLSTIRNADKIALVGDGICKEYGTYEELMELKGEFYEMRRLQTE